MSNIAEVISWKWDDMAGMSTKGNTITAFPPAVPGVTYDANGIPIQANQDTWTFEYEHYKSGADELVAITAETEMLNDMGMPFVHSTIDYHVRTTPEQMENIRRDSKADKTKTYTLDVIRDSDVSPQVIDLTKTEFKDLEIAVNLFATDQEDIQRGKRKVVYEAELPVPTNAVDGAPGHFEPAGTNFADFAELSLSGLVPAPDDQWLAPGNRVILTDGSTAHWDGAMWMAGGAP